MLDPKEFANRLRQCAEGRSSIGQLEGWLDENSWDVHESGNQALVDSVFEFEGLYSALLGERMSEVEFRARLAGIADLLSPVYYQDANLVLYRRVVGDAPTRHWRKRGQLREPTIVIGPHLGLGDTVASHAIVYKLEEPLPQPELTLPNFPYWQIVDSDARLA